MRLTPYIPSKTLAFAFSFAALTNSTHAAPVAFTVDPARSFIAVSGAYMNKALSDPVRYTLDGHTPASSLITSYSGLLSGERDSSANTFQMFGGPATAADLSAEIQGYAASPFQYHVVGFSPDGMQILDGSIRNLSFSFTSPLISTPEAFDAASLAVQVTGLFDYKIVSFSPTTYVRLPDIAGSASLPAQWTLASDTCSLVSQDGIDTLRIPFASDVTVVVESQPVELHFAGTMIASAPEPTALGLFIIPGAIAFALRRRRPHLTRQT